MAKSKDMFTQGFIPVRDVIDGTIITDDNRFIRVLEVRPINLLMKSKGEQDSVLRAYGGLIKGAPPRFSIKCVTRDTPLDAYRKSFETSLKDEQNEKCCEYIENHVDFTQRLSSSQSFERGMYFIFEYDSDGDYYRSLTDQEKIDSLKNTERNLIAEFNALGNSVYEFKEPDIEVCELLYKHYNRRIADYESFQDRVRRISKDDDYCKHMQQNEELPADIRDIVAPKSLNFKESKDYVLIDGMYCTYMYIDRDGYPSEISSGGWLYDLINFSYGIEVDMHFERKDSVEALSKIHSRARQTRLKKKSREENAPDMESINDNLDALLFMREALTRNSEEIYEMSIILSVYAYTKEELYAKRESLTRFAKKEGIELLEFKRCEEEGFLSTAPLNNLTKKAKKTTKHDVYTSLIAAAYPFTSFSLADEGGILIGLHQHNSSMIIFNPFDSKKYSNANITIFGAPGKGKTFTLLSMTTRLRYQGIQVFILAPDKQDEFRRVTDAIGGEFVSVSASANTRINPFEIWPIESEADTLLNNKTGEETSWLIDKIDSLAHWVSMMVPNLSIDDKARIKTCLVRMYQKKGITKDNDSIFKDDSRIFKNEMPTFTDFVRELKNDQQLPSFVVTVFEQFTKKDGPYRNLNGPTNVDLSNKYIVFGLEHLNSELKAPMMYILLKFIWSVSKADKTKNKAIVIDEGSLLVDGKDENVGAFVEEIFRMIRGYGGSAIFATQSIADLYKNDGEFGNTILACSHSHILLGMQPSDIRLIKNELELTASEEIAIRDFSKAGQALLCAGSIHVPVQVKASDKEFDLFTTEAKEYRRILKRNRQ